MNEKEQAELRSRYQNAVDQFVDKLRDDINVIAAIISGSVAYDVLWEKSDVDMTLVVRDQKLSSNTLSIVEDGITFNIYLVQRSMFKRGMERSIGGSVLQSYVAKGKLVYTTDESLYDFFEDIKQIGEDDRAITALEIACDLISTMHKVQKWIISRKDPAYAQYYLLKTAEAIARMELCIRGIPTSRSDIRKALEYNPEVMRVFYQQPMEGLLTEAELMDSVKQLDSYLEDKMDLFKKPVIEYLSDQEIKTTSMIANHFSMDSHYIINVLEYMADKGVIEKVSQLIRLTPKSRMSIEEISFLYIP